MWRSVWLLSASLVAMNLSALAQERLLSFPGETSAFLDAPRHIQIYLPPSYASEPKRRYPVLYLQDGQNVFSNAGTNACFGWGSWELDKTADELCRAGKMREIIMIAIDNSRARLAEYSGATHEADSKTNTPFENYAAYLVKELKPKIDRDYRTQPSPASTAVMGSSLGGICSVVLAWEHPEVFGGAASMSGSFQIDQTNFLRNVLQPYHGPVKPFRVYIDSGVVDFTGGDDNRKLNEQVADELWRIGWKDDLGYYLDAKPMIEAELEKSGLRHDKWPEAQTSQHNEFYWRQRSWRALTFLFPPAK
jgi:predicted alpha/beta superfamily hydrolase